MSRHAGMGDVSAIRAVSRLLAATTPDIVHGHGAKGGAYARLAAGKAAIKAYTPHGGSLHGHGLLTPIYRAMERLMLARTDLFLFESAFARDAFTAQIGSPRGIVRVVHNGVTAAEFTPVAPATDAADIVLIGELRYLKGVDVLIEAMALLSRQGRTISANIVGEGPDRAAFIAHTREHGLDSAVRFVGYRQARDAFGLGRLLVVPSRAESLPYIVLEAAAAGVPMVATRVGGIPEIAGPQSDGLVAPGDPQALADAMAAALDNPAQAVAAASTLRERVRTGFSVDTMVEGILAAYAQALAARPR
jgi:glycosyltransferase involved in cell wall biosynthesis